MIANDLNNKNNIIHVIELPEYISLRIKTSNHKGLIPQCVPLSNLVKYECRELKSQVRSMCVVGRVPLYNTEAKLRVKMHCIGSLYLVPFVF
jgi:hypothetical protein